MKKVNLFLLLCFVTPVAFLACQKTDNEEKAPACVVASRTIATSYDGDVHETLIYDDQLRVVNYILFNGLTGNDSSRQTRVSYNGNKITVIDGELGWSGYKNDTIIYTVSGGKVVTGTQVRVENNGEYDFVYTTSHAYEYNADGYLSKHTTHEHSTSTDPESEPTDYSNTLEYAYKDGNVISETSYNGSHKMLGQALYEYYTDKPAVLTVSGTNSYFQFDAPNVKNLLKKQTNDNTSGGGSVNTEEHNYTFNADGLVDKEIITHPNVGSDTIRYTYNCR